MEHFLDIIIPEYDCKEEFMKRLLHSISRQKNVDFNEIGIIIVNDKSNNKLRKGLFKNFPKLNIEYYLKDVNEGVGMTRQYGLDRSTAKYVTFVDQDDELYGNDSLGKIINNLKKNDYNYLITQYIEEVRTKDGGIFPLLHDKLDAKEVLHGVFIKKQLLIDNEIRFIPGIRYHDDSYLRRVLLFVSPAFFLKEITYIWKCNTDSIVRRERKYDYMVETYDDYFLAIKNTNLYAKKRNIDVAEYNFNAIIGLFCILESKDFLSPDLSDTREKYEKELYDFICQNNYDVELYIDRYKDFYNDVIKTSKRPVSNGETLRDFIERLSKQNNNAYKNLNHDRVLDIIISCEHDDIDLVRRVYTSLKNQLYVNKIEIGLIFVVSKNFDTSLFDIGEDKKSYNIEFIINEKINDSYFNAGLKKSASKYVSFIKDTDVLNGPFEISSIIKRLKAENNYLILTRYIKFNSETNERGYFDSLRFNDVLGMFFQREYIMNNNYNFGEELGIYGERYFAQIVGSSIKAIGLSINSFVSYVDYKTNFIPNPLDALTISDNIDIYIKMNHQITQFLLKYKIGDNNYYSMLFYTSYIFLYSSCINKGKNEVGALKGYYRFIVDNKIILGGKDFFDKVFEEVSNNNTLFLVDIFYDDDFEKCIEFIENYKR